jgi:hypothetical protein
MGKGLSGPLAALILVTAAALPACVPAVCCPVDDAPTMHTAMPCCEGEAAMERSDPAPMKPATPTLQVPIATPVAIVVPRQSVRVQAHIVAGDDALSEPSPPLFLRNEQFLI